MAQKFELAIIIDGTVHTFGELVADSFTAKNGDTATTLKVANGKPVVVDGVEFALSWRSFVSFKVASAKKSAVASQRTSAAEAVKSLLAAKNPTMLSKTSMHEYAEGMNAEILRLADAAHGLPAASKAADKGSK